MKKYTKLYIKQASSHTVGHVYEHVVANHIQRTLIDEGYLRLLDFGFMAYTDDGIVQIMIDSRNKKVIDRFEEIIGSIYFTLDEVKIALTETGCEFEKLPKFDINKLYEDIKTVHKQKWHEYNSFLNSNPIDELGKSLKTSYGQYGRKSPKSYNRYSFVYKIKNCPYDLKPLAVYLIFGIAINQIILTYKDIKECYDAGDDWAKCLDIVGYVHHLKVPKSSSIGLSEIKSAEKKNRKEILNNNYIQKLQDYIKFQMNIDNAFYPLWQLFGFSYQIIGKKGWEKINSKKNIKQLLGMLETQIVDNWTD